MLLNKKLILAIILLIPIVLATPVSYHYETLESDVDNSTFEFPVFEDSGNLTVVEATGCDGINNCWAYKKYY